MNSVWLGGPLGLSSENIADTLGLAHDLGRTYTVQPVNLGGQLGVIFGTLLRDDWQFPTTLYMRGEDGRWLPAPDRFRLNSPQGPIISIAAYRSAVAGFFNDDDLLDLLFFQTPKSPRALIFIGTPSGRFVTDGADVRATWTWPYDGLAFDPNNEGFDQVWLSHNKLEFGTPFLERHRCCSVAAPLDNLVNDASARPTTSLTSGDFDNDMDLDVAALEVTDSEGWSLVIWENDGFGRFHRKIIEGIAGAGLPVSLARADFNLDGALDLVIGDAGIGDSTDPSYTLISGVGRSNNWLEIDLRDPWHLGGLGARVKIHAGNVTQYRAQLGGTHFAAQDHVRLHVGLGNNTEADVEVVWPDGAMSSHRMEANRIVIIEHPQLSAD